MVQGVLIHVLWTSMAIIAQTITLYVHLRIAIQNNLVNDNRELVASIASTETYRKEWLHAFLSELK